MSAARMTDDGYRLLILDGHNSHGTYRFCKFAADHQIIVICLPSHTTHALQPCDVGVFGPLSTCWKSLVNKLTRSYVRVDKTNFILYYSQARSDSLKLSTIKAAFAKTGIWPLNPDAINKTLFEPSKHTTTQAAQPLPAQFPTFLLPFMTKDTETHTGNDRVMYVTSPSKRSTSTDGSDSNHHHPPMSQDQVRCLLIGLPPTLPQTASRGALQHQLTELRAIATAAIEQIQKDYTQMVLMDDENERLRQRALGKEKKQQKKQTTSHPRHLTATEALDALARADFEQKMKNLFKEAVGVFRDRRNKINAHAKTVIAAAKAQEREQKAAERRAATAARNPTRRKGRAPVRTRKPRTVRQASPSSSSTTSIDASQPTARPCPQPRPLHLLPNSSRSSDTSETSDNDEYVGNGECAKGVIPGAGGAVIGLRRSARINRDG